MRVTEAAEAVVSRTNLNNHMRRQAAATGSFWPSLVLLRCHRLIQLILPPLMPRDLKEWPEPITLGQAAVAIAGSEVFPAEARRFLRVPIVTFRLSRRTDSVRARMG